MESAGQRKAVPPDRREPPEVAVPGASEQARRKYYVGRLRNDLKLFQGELNASGELTWVIFDPVADAYFKISNADYQMIRALSGNLELEQYLQKLESLGIHAGKAEVFTLIKFLQDSNLFMPRYLQSEAQAAKVRDLKKRAFWHQVMSTYLFFKIPLLKPDRFLDRTVETVRLIFNKWTLILLWLIALSGYIGLVMNWHKFTEKFISSISLQGLARYTLAVIAVKCIHEFAHAYTAKINGIRVRRMGLAIVFFVPRLYSDLTDSWRIRDRKKRFLIDGAGIISEIIIGGAAALVWVNTVPGLTHSVAYFIFAVSIINTVLINGNPFIRYDGYFMLMDLVGIDNLQQRAVERTKALWRQALFGLELPTRDHTPGWKRYFLVAFGIACFVYRLFLYTSIILLVYFKFPKVIGIVLLALEVYLLLLRPLTGEIRFLTMMRPKMNRKKFLLSSLGGAVIALGFLLPLPWDLTLPGEVRPVNFERVYARAGFLNEIRIKDGQKVGRNQLLFKQFNPYLEWKLQEALVEIERDETILDQAQSNAQRLGEVRIDRRALQSSRNLAEELRRKIALLDIRSNLNGVFAFYDQHLKENKWLQQGEILGEVYNPDFRQVTAYVGEEEMRQLKIGDQVKLYLDGELTCYPGIITAVNDVAAELEPTPLLDVFGGNILSSRNLEQGYFKPLRPHYQVTIKVDDAVKLPIGRSGTVNIRKYSSIGGNMIRTVIQILQRELSF
ncbi:MAG: HlyD family efflux transporter periplasmic adaptor subunit [Victivallaceae bacterium]|nr:HlyD family efflux transporter periplasmic adaptor subunit [Victivallaceae bacterium]